MAKLYIDGIVHEVTEGKNILEVCLSLGYDLPYFCWHPALGSVGACRQCAVTKYKDEKDEKDEKGKLTMACMEPVTDGTRISLMDRESHQFRKSIIEWLMINHPHDCPVCDEGGECHLQDMTVMAGHTYRRFNFNKRTYRNQYLGPFINHEMNRCIQCYRCVRFYRDYAEGDDLDVFAAHDHVYFGRHKDGVLQNEFSGNLIEICPTGVFTDKTLKQHYTRKWDLTTAPSVCSHCGLGCNTIAGERYGSLRRILSRFNHDVNGYFLCDRGRFGYEFVNHPDRLKKGRYTENGKEPKEITTADAIVQKVDELTASSGTIAGIGSPRASLESNYALKKLVGESNFYAGINEKEFSLLGKVREILTQGPVKSASLHEIRKSDAALVLGEDLTQTAPMMALALRETARNKPMKKAAQINIPSWHDAAVRELMQTDRGPVFIASPTPTKLDDIASATIRENAVRIARIGFAIAAYIGSDAPSADISEEEKQKAEKIASDLLAAEHPVIITGTSLMNEALLEAAANIARALYKKDKNTSIGFVVPECNSMGLRMMSEQSIEQYISGNKKAGTVIILENDLYRRIPSESVKNLLTETPNVIVMDHLDNPAAKMANLVIPVGTFAESDGTFVNNEGRAQRFYQVYRPKELIKESWRWLSLFPVFKKNAGNTFEVFDDFVKALASSQPEMAPVKDITPLSDFRKNGQKVARQPARYSGRTAMNAHEDVNEPVPPLDPDSPLTWSMEGYHGKPPAGLNPFYWSPGWNSAQAINKFQIEVGGPLHGGDPGIRLLKPKGQNGAPYFTGIPAEEMLKDDQVAVEPAWHIFGSEELSRKADGIAGLVPGEYIGVSRATAGRLGLDTKDKASVTIDDVNYTVDLKIIEHMAENVIMVPLGIGSFPAFIKDKKAKIEKSSP